MGRASEFALNFRYAFRPRKPRLVARLAAAVLRSKVFGRPPLRYVDFAIGFDCNLHCEHCFATSLRQPGRSTMTVTDYARVVRQCMALGAVNFSFQGGEPLMIDALSDIVAACRPDCNVISVATNGTLLDQDRVAGLKRMGVDILTVSLDSAVAEEHDRFRGVAGTFQKAVSGVKLALSEGLRVTIGTVVTHQTLRSEGITALLKLAGELRVILYLIMPVPAGRWCDNREMSLTPDDLVYINELTQQSPYVRTDFQANLGGYGCGAVKEILYLTPYGDVLPCPFMHIAIGNVIDEPVAAIRGRALKDPHFAAYWPKCLVSTDAEFIEQHLSKTFHADQLPVSWQDVFPSEEGV